MPDRTFADLLHDPPPPDPLPSEARPLLPVDQALALGELPPPPAPPPQASATPVPLPHTLAIAAPIDESPRRKTDPLDPATRHAAQMAPLTFTPLDSTPAVISAPAQTQAQASLESLLPDLVRKIAWAGDGKRGSMRLELGKGALSGGTLVVHADDGRVRVELDAPAGTDIDEWRQRLHQRLVDRGVDVEEVVVR